MNEEEALREEVAFQEIRAAAGLVYFLRTFPQSAAYEAEIAALGREDASSPTLRDIVSLLVRMRLQAFIHLAERGEDAVFTVVVQGPHDWSGTA